jgi:hypothetical protein
MLHVHRRVDVDAGFQELLHILPAFDMSRPRGVGVRQLIHDDQRRMSRQRGVEIELVQLDRAILDDPVGEDVQTEQQRLRLRPAVRLDVSDQHVDALDGQRLGGFEHHSLAHAGGIAEEDRQPSATLRAGRDSRRFTGLG